MRDNETLDFLPAPSAVEGPPNAFSSLAFVGFHLTWAGRIADLEMHIQTAKQWESAFNHWHIDQRNVHLCYVERGYSVDFKDGSAALVVYRPDPSLMLALEHLSFLLRTLEENGRTSVSLMCEAQYLRDVQSAEFSRAARTVASRVFNEDFLRDIGGATLEDFAYHADFTIHGQQYKTKIGVLRSSEVSDRVVSARYLPAIPKVGRFHSVTAQTKITREFSPTDFLSRLFTVGNAIANELEVK
jgi:hypothetical protein